MYEDKTLICKECGEEFVFTAGEQEFYEAKGFVNEPQRCKACRDARKNAARPEREMFIATCASCGGEAKVPFRPREDRRCIAASASQSRRKSRHKSEKFLTFCNNLCGQKSAPRQLGALFSFA